jgi:hypothetical protein
MLSLFWVLLVVEQPTVNANRAMTPIVLNEVRIRFILFLVDDLICRFRRPLVNAQTNRYALRLARDSAQREQIVRRAGVYVNRTLVVLLRPTLPILATTTGRNVWRVGAQASCCGQSGVSPGWEILIGRQDARRPHSQDGYAPQDSDAGQQHQQLPKRQAEQQEGKNHESDANGLETKALSDRRD